jgi:hypothetical protein
MKLFRKRGWFLSLSLVALSGVMRAGPITVTSIVTPLGPLFQYNYTITNNSGDDLEVLDIAVTPGISITGLTATPGFTDAYDPVLGLVSFLEDTSTFGPTPISGFIFDSSLAPKPTTFNGTLLDANFNLVNTGGNTTGPVAPEPGYLLLLIVWVPLFLYRYGRPRPTNSNPQTSIQKEDLECVS